MLAVVVDVPAPNVDTALTVPPLAVNHTDPPAQIAAEAGVMITADGVGLTVII